MADRQERARQRLNEQKRRALYRWIGRILAVGFWTSMVLILIGLATALEQGKPLGEEVAPLVDVVPSLLDFDPQGIVDAGILLLLFTPSLYVLGSLVIFLRQRDRTFVVVCCALLAIMSLSVGLGVR